MKRLGRPDVALGILLSLLAALGAVLLAHPDCTQPYSKDLRFYATRHAWQAAFDALSAACGVGLLTYSFEADYTPRGRWTLTAIGLCGALLYLHAAARAARRWLAPHDTPHLVGVGLILGIFVGAQVVLAVGLWLLTWASSTADSASDTILRAVAAFASLGWKRESSTVVLDWATAAVAWIGALGWPLWLALLPARRGTAGVMPGRYGTAGAYTVFLVLAAALICALEAPRSSRATPGEAVALSGQPAPTRFARSLLQTVSASGAGLPTERLSEGRVGEGAKIVLAGVVLVGGLGGSAGGGIKWLLLAVTVSGGMAWFSRRRSEAPKSRPIKVPPEEIRTATNRPSTRVPLMLTRARYRGLSAVCIWLALALIVAFGLLLIEAYTASPFQPRPTFADAFLDASSAVAGANLTSGLSAAVTSRSLTSGMRHEANTYQYGFVWIMLSMLLGRVAPLYLLLRIVRRDVSAVRRRGLAPV